MNFDGCDMYRCLQCGFCHAHGQCRKFNKQGARRVYS